jgi:hypothetical protein
VTPLHLRHTLKNIRMSPLSPGGEFNSALPMNHSGAELGAVCVFRFALS